MWYVIQTTTGKEQELVDVIHKSIPPDSYKACFFMKRELLKRLGGRWLEVTETLFPAYVFLDMDQPDQMFYHLKKVPELTKILGDSHGTFIPLEAEEVKFLKVLCDRGEEQAESVKGRDAYLVRLTKVYLDETGTANRLEGPLGHFKEKIIRLNLRKRYAIIEMILRGERQTAMLGIKLEKD